MAGGKGSRLFPLTALLCVALLLQACTSVAYIQGQKTVGRLRTIGPAVLVNDQPARDGQTIEVKDRLRTGPGSSAYVHFLGSGFVHLDESTDPYFELRLRGIECAILTLGLQKGQIYHEAGHQCVTTVQSRHGEWTQPARQFNVFNLKVDPDRSVLTLLDGKLSLSRPSYVELQPREQITVTAAGVVERRTLSPRQLDEVTRWRRRFPPPCPGGGGDCAPAGGLSTAGQCTD